MHSAFAHGLPVLLGPFLRVRAQEDFWVSQIAQRFAPFPLDTCWPRFDVHPAQATANGVRLVFANVQPTGVKIGI